MGNVSQRTRYLFRRPGFCSAKDPEKLDGGRWHPGAIATSHKPKIMERPVLLRTSLVEVQLWTLCAATFKNLIWTLDEVNRFCRTMLGVAPSSHHRPLLRPLRLTQERHRGIEARG